MKINRMMPGSEGEDCLMNSNVGKCKMKSASFPVCMHLCPGLGNIVLLLLELMYSKLNQYVASYETE